MVAHPATTPGRSRNEEAFLRLALAHACSAAGDAMVTIALAGSIFFSTSVNGAHGRVLLSMLLTMAPFAVVAPFLGPVIDKSKGGRRMMVILSAVGRCIAAIYMARVVHNLLLFLPAALAVLILSKAHAIAKSALVPATVDSPSDLVRAGGRLAVFSTLAGFAASGPAWALLKLFGAAWSLRLAGVVYLVGAVMALRTRPAPPAALDPADHVDEQVRSRGVSLAAIAMASIRGISGFLTFAVAFGFRRAHAPTWWFGLVLASALVGGFTGNVVGPRLRGVLREERILLLGVGVVAACGLFVALLGNGLGIMIVAFAVGLADGVGQLSFDAIVQRDGSEGSRGRSFARFEATFQLTWVAAAVIPVAISIPVWVSALMIGLAASASALNYAAGRYVVSHRPLPRAARPGDPPDPPDPPSDRVSDPVSDPLSDPPERPVRTWDGGVQWAAEDDAEPAPLRDLAPGLPDPPGPRRNPRRNL